MSIQVDNLSYCVPQNMKQKFEAALKYRYSHKQNFNPTNHPDFKQIIKNVSLDVNPGEFVAIIGSSGCGKTSLINIICNRLYTKTFSGTVKINNQQIGPWIKKVIGYVQQEDILEPSETVKEAISFVADLKLSGSNHNPLIERIMTTLNLQHISNSMIGAPAGQGFSAGSIKSGISGGERRRTSIAKQIVSGAEILILDECTSGLDVYTANQLITMLKELSGKPFDSFVNPESVKHNLTVMTTIHQPTSQMWEQFDRVLVMKQGQILLNIKTSDYKSLLLQNSISSNTNVNPADFIIEMLSQPSQAQQLAIFTQIFHPQTTLKPPQKTFILETQETIIPTEFDSQAILSITPTPSQIYSHYRSHPSNSPSAHTFISLYEIFNFRSKYAKSYPNQFSILLKRAFLKQIRCPVLFFRFLLQYTVVALFAGSLWWRLNYTFIDVGNRIGAIFFIQISLVFPPSADAAQRWFQKRQTYLAEHAQGLYGTAGYFLAELVVDLPIYVFMVFYCIIISYFMIRINDSFQLCLLLGVQFLMMLYSTLFMAIFFQFIFSSFVAAIAVFMTLISIFVVFAGPYINSKTIPSYWSWMPWVSQFAYMFRSYLYLILYGQEVICDPGQSCPLDSGQSIYDVYGQEGWSLVSATLTNIGYTCGIIVGFGIGSYFMLRYRRFS